MYIQCELVEETDLIETFVDKDELAKYKNEIVNNGELRAYIVAHEGTSRGREVQNGQTGRAEISWPRQAIRDLTSCIAKGTKFFIGHRDGTNSHDGRSSVGRVVSSFVRNVNDKLQSIAVGFFPDKSRTTGMDFCSLEANVNTRNDAVCDVEDCSGIALGSLKEGTPGFPGTVLLQSLQCFSSENGDKTKYDKSKNGDPNKNKEDKKEKTVAMTVDEIKTAVVDMGLMAHKIFSMEEISESLRVSRTKPSDLFEFDSVKKDTGFKDNFEGYATLETDKKKLESDLKKSQADATKYQTDSLASSEKQRIMDGMGEGVTVNQQKFIMERYTPDPQKPMDDEGIKTFIETGKTEFSKFMKLVGAEDKSDKLTKKADDVTDPTTETKDPPKKDDPRKDGYVDPNSGIRDKAVGMFLEQNKEEPEKKSA